MTPWLQDPDITLYHGDCLEVLRELPSGSVHMCATSPPFYGLRDYGTDGQIGLEETPDQWVARLVAVFREVRRVLRDDGTLWVEIGDSYASTAPGTVVDPGKMAGKHVHSGAYRRSSTPRDCKPKDLLGQTWLLAFALRADGWWLRSEIIWARPNPMPESVTDRPTKSHSTVFLLSKQPRYFYDADAIRQANSAWSEKALEGNWQRRERSRDASRNDQGDAAGANYAQMVNPAGANARSVWTIPTEPTPFAHFATWPQALVRRMILAGTSERGCCPECGAPWVRDVEREPNPTKDATGPSMVPIGPNGERDSRYRSHGGTIAGPPPKTLGWSPSCECYDKTTDECGPLYGTEHAAPCTVLDPFAGSGTTMLVARNHGRHSIGIELNEEYLRIAAKRLQQLSLLTEG